MPRPVMSKRCDAAILGPGNIRSAHSSVLWHGGRRVQPIEMRSHHDPGEEQERYHTTPSEIFQEDFTNVSPETPNPAKSKTRESEPKAESNLICGLFIREDMIKQSLAAYSTWKLEIRASASLLQ
ncbi:uncharacterized protein Z518_01239 [Rhinocladiella mackenziei CBS 650.93]|uniref:Uncharacterized protein n=1 Tax=Rhinocladiella mackenziei CBS 650.93 TaxID=1442369 RepID=A0A0D2HHL0_9EURO|nr:uncharacterized protein Z518_01239 [Rhinocladiella mackenziei CBS 650.93]KIX10158.1 hypothetical protein Z518_01239 [Rhinocladiella mackenziei CBS 650.93]